MMTENWARTLFLILLTILACGCLPGEIQPGEEGKASLFKSAKMPLPGLISDAEQFDQHSNRERLQVLKSLLFERNLDFEVQRLVNDQDEEASSSRGNNVVLNFGSGNRVLVVGAHFDAVRLAGGRIGPGMVDNAAGVVILIRLADAIQHYRFNKRIHIVFFDLEETGLVGSEKFVSSLEADRIEAMINVDIVGCGDTVVFGPSSGKEQVQLDRAVRSICSELSIDCFVSPRLPVGDHQSFQSMGIPSISLAVLPSAEAHQTWLMFNKPEESGLRDDFAPSIARIIHTSNDTTDKLDPVAMTMTYNLIGSLLVELDQLSR